MSTDFKRLEEVLINSEKILGEINNSLQNFNIETFHKLKESISFDAQNNWFVFDSGDGVQVNIVEIKVFRNKETAWGKVSVSINLLNSESVNFIFIK